MKKITKIINQNVNLIIIIFISFVFRLTGLINIDFSRALDFQRDWKIVNLFFASGKISLVGPTASINPNFHLGPFYYYLLSFFRMFSSDPRIVVIFLSLLGSGSTLLIYLICRNWFSKKISLLTSIIHAFSCYAISIEHFPSNVYVLPFFALLSLFILLKIINGNVNLTPLLFFILGLTLQTHATAIFLLPVFVFLLPLKKISTKIFLISCFVLLLSFTSWFFHNFQCNFCEFQEVFRIFERGSSSEILNLENLYFIFGFFPVMIFAQTSILLKTVFVFIAIFFFLKETTHLKKLFFVWLFIPSFLMLFYPEVVFGHYFLIFYPLPFLLLAFILNFFNNMRKWKMITHIIFLLSIILNLARFFQYLQTPRF